MRHYDYNPRPQIEDHYHIRELIEGQEKRSNDRIYHQLRVKTSDERNNDILDSKVIVLTDFWCDDCKLDFKSIAIRQIEIDWSNSKQNIALYKTKCDCGKWCMRLITDKNRDAYWTKSKAVRVDRGRHSLDLLQPHENGFVTLYGKR